MQKKKKGTCEKTGHGKKKKRIENGCNSEWQEIVTPPPPKKVWKYFWRALQDGVGKKAQFVAETSKYNWTAHNY